MLFADHYKCMCNKKIVSTNFCPNCGKPNPTKQKLEKKYRYEGMRDCPGSYAVKTSEFREPKKGEYYLSGCKGHEIAYKAPNNLSTKYRIMGINKA